MYSQFKGIVKNRAGHGNLARETSFRSAASARWKFDLNNDGRINVPKMADFISEWFFSKILIFLSSDFLDVPKMAVFILEWYFSNILVFFELWLPQRT